MVIKLFSLLSILYFSGLLLLSGAVSADDERGAHFISVQLENDSINNKNDGYYTNGMEVSLLRGEELPLSGCSPSRIGYHFIKMAPT